MAKEIAIKIKSDRKYYLRQMLIQYRHVPLYIMFSIIGIIFIVYGSILSLIFPILIHNNVFSIYIALGIIFVFMPAYRVLAGAIKVRNDECRLAVDESNLVISAEKNSTTIDLSNILLVRKKKRFLQIMIKMNSRKFMSLFVPCKNITGDYNEFTKILQEKSIHTYSVSDLKKRFLRNIVTCFLMPLIFALMIGTGIFLLFCHS